MNTKQLEKSKYPSLDEWKLADPLAYKIAVRRKYLPKICTTFGWELPIEKPLTPTKDGKKWL
jgi:hypothetical protein